MRSVGFGGHFSGVESIVNIFEFEPLEEIQCCFGKCPVCNRSKLPEEWNCEVALEYPLIVILVLLCKRVHVSDLRMACSDLNSTVHEIKEIQQISNDESPIWLELIAAYSLSLGVAPLMALESDISSDGVVPEEHEVNE